MTKTFQHKIEYSAVKVLIAVFNLLPLKLALRFGDIMGFITFSIFRVRRKVALQNLKKSFGDKYTDKEYRRIALRSYINFSRGMIEFGLLPKLSRMDLGKFIKIVGDEKLTEHFKTDKGAVLISGHFGSFEMIAPCFGYLKWPMDLLVGKQRNLLVNDLINKHRAIFSTGLIEIGVSARGVISSLKKGRAVGMLSDQDAGSDGVIIDFLGRPASTAKGPAAFALKTKCPIFIGLMVREGLANHTIYIEKPETAALSGNKENDIKMLTQAYTDILAKYVTRYPDHYFWAHRRWKTTCPEDYN